MLMVYVYTCLNFVRSLRGYIKRMVFKQQVFAFRRYTLKRTNGQLRAFYGSFNCGGCFAYRFTKPSANCSAPVRLEMEYSASAIRLFNLPCCIICRNKQSSFDLPEAEPELVGGYHTEYSSMKFALFFLAEYANMIVAACVITTLYLGGWQFPYLQTFGLSPMVTSLLQVLAFCLKVGFLIFFFIWVRWSLPRFRYDQLMNLGWKVMLPLSIANIIVTAIIVSFLK